MGNNMINMARKFSIALTIIIKLSLYTKLGLVLYLYITKKHSVAFSAQPCIQPKGHKGNPVPWLHKNRKNRNHHIVPMMPKSIFASTR